MATAFLVANPGELSKNVTLIQFVKYYLVDAEWYLATLMDAFASIYYPKQPIT